MTFPTSDTAAVAASPYVLQLNAAGNNGAVRTTEPGRACADGGDGSYRHFSSEAALAPADEPTGVFRRARTTLDIHYDAPSGELARSAFLLGTESHVTLSNHRGTVQIPLPSGSCRQANISLSEDLAGTKGLKAQLGDDKAFPGTWGTVSGTGAYRSVSGSGTYGFFAHTAPGADNDWQVRLQGTLAVPQPAPSATVVQSYWGNLGLDYVSRVVTVVFQVRNRGQGDGFGVEFRATRPSAGVNGVTPCKDERTPTEACPTNPPPPGPAPRPLGDLPACPSPQDPSGCDSEMVTVRYKLGLTAPCGLVVLGCEFRVDLDFRASDALDRSSDSTLTGLSVRAPDLPPPL